MHKPRQILMLTLAFFALFAGAAFGQTYPNKPITLVVPFGAGTGADTAARIVADQMGPKLGTTIVIDNRVGASGIVGSSFVAHAAADGYTLLLVSNSTHGTNPSLFRSLPYDPIKSFAPVGRFGRFTYLLTVNAKLPFSTVKDLVVYAKANPNKLSYAAGQSTSQIMAEVFKTDTGTSILSVPYTSSPQALTDVIAGRVSMMFIDVAASAGFLKAGSLRALAVTSKERSEIMPEVPTIASAIGSEFELEAWTGIVAPAGVPKADIDKVNAAMNAALTDPKVKQRMFDLRVEPQPSTPEEFGTFIASEVSRLGKFIKEAGMKPQ